MISDGIENRIVFAAPGTIIALRPNSADLPYDEVRQITWGDVMDVLSAAGVVEKVKDNTWKKKVIALGIDKNGDDQLQTGTLVNKHDADMLAQLDIANPQQCRILVRLHLEREIRESALRHGAHDFSELIEPLTDAAIEAMAVIEEGRVSDTDPNWSRLRSTFFSVLEAQDINLQDKDGWVTYKGERKQMFPGRMVNSWASRVCQAYKLPVF